MCPIGGTLRDYDTFRWGPYEFFVLPSPGHTAGSITLVATIDGKKVAFSGDVIHSPGKVQNLYDLQYFYNSTEGVDLLVSTSTVWRRRNRSWSVPPTDLRSQIRSQALRN